MNNRPYKSNLSDLDYLYLENIDKPNISDIPRKLQLSTLKAIAGGGLTLPGNENEAMVNVSSVLNASDELQNVSTNVDFDGRYYGTTPNFSMRIFKDRRTVSGSQTINLHTLVASQNVFIETNAFISNGTDLSYVVAEASFDRFQTSRMQGTQNVISQDLTDGGTFSHQISGDICQIQIVPPAGTWTFSILSLIRTSHA